MNPSVKLLLRRNVDKLSCFIRTPKAHKPPSRCLLPAIQHRNYRQNQSKGVYLVDEANSEAITINNVNKYTQRNHTCGELRAEHVGQRVILCGWLEFQRMNKFVVLRDAYGHTQLVIEEDNLQSQQLLHGLPYESVIKVKGTVVARPKEMANKQQPTGEIEILVQEMQILNRAKETLPFNIREFQKAKEPLRMQHRYLDMRFSNMQRNLRVRSKLLADMRNFLIDKADFVEVETPTLFKATPGGAQEFVVPTRYPGLFYSLVQSPQQFKQMLMAGAVDRYFQMARCYRDEGARSDRQPEFTQLDLELSFTNQEGILSLIEDMFQHAWPEFLPPLPMKFPRISYRDALEWYGSDKPDTRFDFKLKNVSHLFENGAAYAVTFEEKLNVLTKSRKDKFNSLAKQYPATKLLQVKFSAGDFMSKVGKLVQEDVAQKLVSELELKENSVLFLALGDKHSTLDLLGKIRVDYVQLLREKGLPVIREGMHMLWVLDFPLFELGEACKLQTVHHPFTAPLKEDEHLLRTAPLKMRSQAYDLVLNGHEIGGGSVRIHDAVQQEEILEMLRIPESSLKHFLDMLGSGCPPHGGIALGVDRLLAVMLDAPSIRDVIAFPKTYEGRDPISGAPCTITDKDRETYHIQPVLSK